MEQPIVPIRRSRDGDPLVPDDLARDERRVDTSEQPADTDVAALREDLRRAVRGEVRFDRASRAMYAVDASNYRQPPIGVVVPRDDSDVIAAVAVARAHRVPVLGRGGGTSLSGQCCNVALVLDFSKYLRRVERVDPEARRAVVQPGVILDHLRAAAAPHGLTFGPDPATHTHCTLGGMIGNNSCGIHAVMSEFYGPGPRTEHNVHELDVLTYDGARLRVGATSEADYQRILRRGGREADIYRRLRALVERHADRIRREFPDIPRRVSGYNLPALLPENGFHVARALVGTESTCVIVLGATVELIRDFPHRALLVLGYPDAFQAADHVPEIRELRPIGLEGMDARLLKDIRRSDINPDYIRHLPPGDGFLLVEFGGVSAEEARGLAERACARLERGGDAPAGRIVDDPEVMHQVWQIRESGLGATAFVPGQAAAWPGWEDAAVPPDRTGAYLREFKALLDRYGYGAALYGHYGQGCIHCRIDFDLTSRAGVESYRRFTAEAADLVVRFGGSLSGEHGDGQARGDLLGKMFSPEMLEAFREFKRIWDPDGRMNPGKVIDARARTEDLRLGEGYRPWRPATHFQFPEDGGEFARAALRCVGVGKCRRTEGGTMCPSYMVTLEEKHTTRGRAHLLHEMVTGQLVDDGWDSEEVKESLELCLACKGCKGDCPVNVDIATYKAEFLAHYYARHRRPRHAYAFGWIHRWARLGAEVPELANLVMQTPGLRPLAQWLAGLTGARRAPRFARRTFKGELRRRRSRGGPRRVILWADTFNNHFYPDTLMAAVEVLEHAGYTVEVPRQFLCCGRGLYDYGMLDTARALWRKTLHALRRDIRAGVPVVGVEPSCVAAFRDELPGLFPDDPAAARLAAQTHTLEELLARRAADGWAPPRLEGRRALLHGHCHEKAVLDFSAETRLLEALGLDLEVLDAGCCGLAGSFGFERGNYEVSMAVGERVLLPAVRRADEALIIADGFSCREQVRHGTGRRPLHVAEVLRLAYREGGAGAEG